jgi:RNA polymerase sigma-70 factor (ECF subfamily)
MTRGRPTPGAAGADAPAGGGPPRPAEVVDLSSRRKPSPADQPLEALLARFGTRLRSLVAQHCRADQGLDPDDVEQEVRIRLWRALQRDRNAVLPASYIQRVVVSTVIDQLRRIQARPSEPLPEFEEADDPGLAGLVAPDALASASERQRLDLLARCLAGLPERRRLPVELALQGFTPQEMAEVTGLSPESARKLAERGMKEVRERLARYGIQGDDHD